MRTRNHIQTEESKSGGCLWTISNLLTDDLQNKLRPLFGDNLVIGWGTCTSSFGGNWQSSGSGMASLLFWKICMVKGL